ncbi:MAG: AI-2E family transporter, partial [Anaerolineae bacterium]
MPKNSWFNLLLILLVIIAGAYIAQMVLGLVSQFSDIILLFVFAWLISFALDPLVRLLCGWRMPRDVPLLVGRVLGRRGEVLAKRFRTNRTFAVAIIYLGVALALGFGIAALVPPTLVQVNQFVVQLPTLAQYAPVWANSAQQYAADMGLRNINVEAALTGILGSIQTLVTSALQNAVVILTSILSLAGNLLFVLILSFFFALDGPRLFGVLYNIVPKGLKEEVDTLAQSIDRTFGGFIRAQLLQSLLVGIGTLIVTTLFAQPFSLVASLFAGLLMLIPFAGPALALVPPLLTALIHNPDQVLWTVGLLLVYQLVVVNVVMPKILSDALGLHPLVVIASLLIGVKIAGFWGAFFGVPVAGVIAAMAIYFYRRWTRDHVQVQVDATDPLIADPPSENQPASSATQPKLNKERV